MRCPICDLADSGIMLMCQRCNGSYYKASRKDDGTLHATLCWVARRARWGAQQKRKRAAKGWRA